MNALGMPAAAEPRRLRGAAESGVPVRTVATSSAGAGAGWLKPEPPFLPGLANVARVHAVIDAFKAEFDACLDAALEHLFTATPHLRALASNRVWRLALYAQRYGAIYFLSRREAAAAGERLGEDAAPLRTLDGMLNGQALTHRLFNYAVCAWIHARPARRHYARIRLPRNGIMAQGRDAVFVNRRDFDGVAPADVFACDAPLYDLHDFVHYVCASVSDELYGCKYFGRFSRLDREAQALVRDHRYRDEAPTLFGDSLMFRQLSLPLFDALQDATCSDRQVVDRISQALARYLRAEVGLLQPATGRTVHAPGVMDARTLAVLSQNKAYEHSASECEELMFIRGGLDPSPDRLSDVATVDRIALMARLPLQYHERRNFLRHRAQKRAYLLHARYLKASAADDDVALLDRVIANLTFADYLAGDRLDLYEHLELVPPGRSPRSGDE